MSRRPTMVIADDHPILRNGLKECFQSEGGFDVLGAVGDAGAALNLCRQHQPDVLLLDVEMPGRDSLGAMVDVRHGSPGTRIVMVTALCTDAVIGVALKHGAAGYLLKSDPPEAIVSAVKRVLNGERVYSTGVLARLTLPSAAAAATRHRNAPGAVGVAGATVLSALTPREMEVLRGIGRGHSNSEMAETMHLSVRTVERHVFRLMETLNIHDRTRLTAMAHESGLVG